MQSLKTFIRSLAIMAIIASVCWQRAGAEKPLSCCKSVSNAEVTDPITGFRLQREENKPCVRAVILTTEKGEFCCPVGAPWVRTKIQMLMKKLRSEKTTQSPLSLLTRPSQRT